MLIQYACIDTSSAVRRLQPLLNAPLSLHSFGVFRHKILPVSADEAKKMSCKSAAHFHKYCLLQFTAGSRDTFDELFLEDDVDHDHRYNCQNR